MTELEKQKQLEEAGSTSLAKTTQNAKNSSAAVSQTQNYLQSLLEGKPADFSSQYQGQIESLYNKIMNRDKFSYDAVNDPLYQQYKNQYTQMGQLAMRDTVGDAAALTGGYGNSWAATAGNQAYQGYLQQLTNKVPELYNSAYSRYAQEGDDLQNQLAMASSLYENEYAKYLDNLNFMQTSQQNAFNQAMKEKEYAQAVKESAFNQAMTLVSAGMMPTDELIAAAGLTKAELQNYINSLTKSSKKSSGSSKKPSITDTPGNTVTIDKSSTQNERADYLQKAIIYKSLNNAATKAGSPLSPEERNELKDRVFNNPNEAAVDYDRLYAVATFAEAAGSVPNKYIASRLTTGNTSPSYETKVYQQPEQQAKLNQYKEEQEYLRKLKIKE